MPKCARSDAPGVLQHVTGRPIWLIFPYPNTVFRPVGNKSSLEMDSQLTNFKDLSGCVTFRDIRGGLGLRP